MSQWRRLFVSGLVVAGALTSPAVALGAANGSNIPLIGQTTGVTTVGFTAPPQPLHAEFSGQLTVLGRFTGTSDGWFNPGGGPAPPFPFTTTATETLVAADGSELFGSLSGSGEATGGATEGTNMVTITGGTGRFADASGTYTESVNTVIVSGGSVITADTTSTIRGSLNLGAPSGRPDSLRPAGDRHLKRLSGKHRHRR